MLNSGIIILEDQIYNSLDDKQKDLWIDFLQKCIIQCEEDNNFGYRQSFFESPDNDLDILDIDDHTLIYYVFLVLDSDQDILEVLHIIFNIFKIKIKDYERNMIVNPMLYLLNNPTIQPTPEKINDIKKILTILLDNGSDPHMMIYNDYTCITIANEVDMIFKTDFEAYINDYWNFDHLKYPE